MGGDAARDAARRELERGEYHRSDDSITQRVLEWINDRLDSLPGIGHGNGPLLVLLLIVLAIGVALALRARRTSRTRARSPRSARVDDLLATTSAREHRRRAAELERAGRLAEAMREWLRAAVATIEERGVLPPRPGRTGAATAREAGPRLPAAADALAAATSAFDQVWFGGRTVSPGDVALARRAADAVSSGRIAEAAHVPGGFVAPW